MKTIGKIDIDDIKYTVNADDGVTEAMARHNIDAYMVMATVIGVADKLDENLGDDMFIQNEENHFVLVASIEEEEVNLLAIVLEENVIINDGESITRLREKEHTEKESAEDIYEKLLDSQISYLIFDDPLENYTHLTNEEKHKVKAYMMDDTHLWDFAPIAEFISDNIPNTFQDQNYAKYGVRFKNSLYDKHLYKEDLCTIDLYKDEIEYRLYQHYLLNFEYGTGNTPVCFGEFVSNELESEDYLDSIEGIEL